MSVNFDRRNFLKGTAAVTGSLAVPSFVAQAAESVAALGKTAVPAYGSWKDVYRSQWTWDRVVRSSHLVNCWYQAHCPWDVYVKDGLVFREEQAGEYEQVRPDLPDFNPRGCQKGGCFSERMYDPTRITHPLRRLGPRGSGKWERVSWEEALDDIADTYLDVTVKEGTDRTIWDNGPGLDLGVSYAAQQRFSMLTQSISLDMNGEISDARRGTYETFGKITFERSADDYFNSDLILCWGANPVFTQIPNAHFYLEAKYRGARIIAISPDYSPSATKADLWVPVRAATDAALALGISHVLMEEGKINRPFIQEQTDLPLLVRSDTGRFLVEEDLVKEGSKDRYYVWDEKTGKIAVAPWKSLQLADLTPALETRQSVRLHDGKEVEVRTVYSRLRERIAEYTPENASKLCGVTPEMIRRLAHEIAASKAVTSITTSCLGKFYRGNLTERSIILIFCLTGNMGRKGAGFSGFPALWIDGIEKFTIPPTLKEAGETFARVAPIMEQRRQAGDSDDVILADFGRLLFQPGNPLIRLPVWTPGALFWQVHGGILELADNSQQWDPFLKRPVRAYLAESLEKQWQPLFPPPDREPRILFSLTSNPLRRLRASHKVLETLWPKLRKVVVLEWRMNSTTRHADYVLPAAPWYERTNLKWVTPLSPYMVVADQATKPLGESKNDWWIIVTLTKHIQKRARERGITSVKSPQGVEVKLDRLYDDITMQGMFTENDEEKVAKTIYDLSSTHKKMSWEEVKKKGFARFERLGEDIFTSSNMCDIPENDTMVPLAYHVQKKVPYPTATRRIQFYLDHPLYEELDEVLPRYKAPPSIGGNHPLVLSGGKTRWSIHSTWRDSETMLRLHRPEPHILISIADAASRGIKDGDWVKVRNDIASFQARAKVSPAMQPGQTLMYHAWESYQFRGKGDQNHVLPTPINPVELAGGHPHLTYRLISGQSSFNDRDTRIEVERLPQSTTA